MPNDYVRRQREMEAMSQAPLWPRFTGGLSGIASGLGGMLETPKDIKHRQDTLRRRLIANQKAAQARQAKESRIPSASTLVSQKTEVPLRTTPAMGAVEKSPESMAQPGGLPVRQRMLGNLLQGVTPSALSGKQPPEKALSLGGGGGMNPMAAILMGLGGGLSSRASGGTLGQGFGQGARLGMSMAQAKQARGKQEEILKRQNEADRREERRLKLLEDKRAEEESAFKSRQSYVQSALAGGDLSPSARMGILGGTDPYKTVAQDIKAQKKETSASAKGYSKALRDNLGVELPKAEKAGKMMAENPNSFGSIYKVVQGGGDVTPDLLAEFNKGASVNRIDPDGTVILNPAPRTFAPDVTGRRLAPPPGVY